MGQARLNMPQPSKRPSVRGLRRPHCLTVSNPLLTLPSSMSGRGAELTDRSLSGQRAVLVCVPTLGQQPEPRTSLSQGGDLVEPLTLTTLSAWEHFRPWNGVGASPDLGLPVGRLQGGLHLLPLLPQNQCVLPSQACPSPTRAMALQVDGNPVFSEVSSKGIRSPRRVVTAAGKQVEGQVLDPAPTVSPCPTPFSLFCGSQ